MRLGTLITVFIILSDISEILHSENLTLPKTGQMPALNHKSDKSVYDALIERKS